MGRHVEYAVEYRWPDCDKYTAEFHTLADARKFAKEWTADGYKCKIIKETTTWTREEVK